MSIGAARPRPSPRTGTTATALAALVIVGIGLRALAMLAVRPAFIGYPDTGWYVAAAHEHLFGDPWRPVGYALFLRIPHLIDANLSFTILLQHGLGVAAALLLFLTVRRVAPAAWALLPAAVVLLAGPEILLEHSVLSEALFVFLIALLVYLTSRALERQTLPWAFLVGLTAAAVACVRAVGLLLPIVVGLALVLGGSRSLGRRLSAGVVVAFAALLVLVPHVLVMTHETNYDGISLTRTGGWAMYGRAAPFADCQRFTPPHGTRGLCEDLPPSLRPDPPFYNLTAGSPARTVFGDPRISTPRVNSQLSAFARAAILHQPLDYARAVGTDLTRFWSSDHGYDTYAGQSYTGLRLSLLGSEPGVERVVRRWYPTGTASSRSRALDALLNYEHYTRLEGPLLILLVLVAVAGLPFARGERLTLGLLLVAVAAVTLVAPVMSAFFDARYAIPGYGPLAAVAAIGGASLAERIGARRRAPSSAPTPVAAVES